MNLTGRRSALSCQSNFNSLHCAAWNVAWDASENDFLRMRAMSRSLAGMGGLWLIGEADVIATETLLQAEDANGLWTQRLNE